MIRAILLAAGQSKRLKGENKLTQKFKNKPLINHAINSLIKSKISKIIVVVGHDDRKIKKIIKKNKKIIFILNKKYKSGISSSIRVGLKKISKKNKGFIVVQSDMPFIKSSDINKICNSIKSKKFLVYALKFRNRIGNPIGFDISIVKKFKKMEGDVGAKFMVKRLKKKTKFIKVLTKRVFKDLDLRKDFN